MRNDTLAHLNLLPLNLVAALKLKAAGVTSDPSQLAAFQLMQWGLDVGVALTHGRTAAELERLSRSVPPAEALEYLVAKLPGGMPALHKQLLRLKPRAAAEYLLDVLDMRLKADPRNPYPAP